MEHLSLIHIYLSAFSWGHGISIDTDNDFMKDKKGFEKISGGRMFTAYLCLGGHYASEAVSYTHLS